MKRTFKDDWKMIVVQAVTGAVVLLLFVFALAYGMGGPQRDAQVSRDVQAVKVLICKALVEADNPALVTAVRAQCKGIV